MYWPPERLHRALERGWHRRELAAFLGRRDYAALVPLAAAAAAARRAARRARGSPAPTVYLVPGLLGSLLGIRRTGGAPPQVLWPDPTDVAAGRLALLRSGASRAVRAMGAVTYSYLGLQLRLEAAGFRVIVHDYDWREDLAVHARRLAARWRADAATELAVVAHSMGALLARAALPIEADAERRITRLIGLGAPHGGAIGAVQALRGSYPVVGRLAALDPYHDAAGLSGQVFRTFTSLYELLPAPAPALDLYRASAWPRQGLQPDRRRLQAARRFLGALAPADRRFASIIGTGQRTATGIERHGGQFRYEITSAGDGTVSTERAMLPGASDYFLRCEHGALPRSERVAAAVVDLLRTGQTRRLARRPPRSALPAVHVSDAVLRAVLASKVSWQGLSSAAQRRYLEQLNAPPACYRDL